MGIAPPAGVAAPAGMAAPSASAWTSSAAGASAALNRVQTNQSTVPPVMGLQASPPAANPPAAHAQVGGGQASASTGAAPAANAQQPQPSLEPPPMVTEAPGGDNGGDEEYQCCRCQIDLPDIHDVFVCQHRDTDRGRARRGPPCDHILCEQCVRETRREDPGAPVLCPCHQDTDDEEEDGGNGQPLPPPRGPPPPQQPDPVGGTLLERLLLRMVENDERVAKALELQAANAARPRQRTFLKTEQTLKFPVGSLEALDDLEGWL